MPVLTADDCVLKVREIMAAVQEMAKGESFEDVHPGRHRNLRTNIEFETSYVHGTGTLRIYGKGDREPSYEFSVRGRTNDEMEAFAAIFPEYLSTVQRLSTRF